jgi:hypothetical protein
MKFVIHQFCKLQQEYKEDYTKKMNEMALFSREDIREWGNDMPGLVLRKVSLTLDDFILMIHVNVMDINWKNL